MEWISFAIDFVLHLDHYLNMNHFVGCIWTYLILFIVIFIETGLLLRLFFRRLAPVCCRAIAAWAQPLTRSFCFSDGSRCHIG